MEMNQTSNRIHPLMAGAAASVMLVSLIGVAAITGVLPNSHGTVAPMANAAAPTVLPVVGNVPATDATPYQYAMQAPAMAAPVVHHKPVTHHAPTVYSQAAPSTQYAQASSNDGQPYPQPVQQPIQQPAAQHSTVGIATGAVIGGLLGNQVGGGNGRALATVAGGDWRRLSGRRSWQEIRLLKIRILSKKTCANLAHVFFGVRDFEY
ncbi:hypothetical protein ACFS07_11025 [Undibacterium arcticum]